MNYLHLHFDLEHDGNIAFPPPVVRRFEVVNHFGPCIAEFDLIQKNDLEQKLGLLLSQMLRNAEAVFVKNSLALSGIAVYTFLENFDSMKEIDLTEMLFEQP